MTIKLVRVQNQQGKTRHQRKENEGESRVTVSQKQAFHGRAGPEALRLNKSQRICCILSLWKRVWATQGLIFQVFMPLFEKNSRPMPYRINPHLSFGEGRPSHVCHPNPLTTCLDSTDKLLPLLLPSSFGCSCHQVGVKWLSEFKLLETLPLKIGFSG
jgi:hypothetical protein